ncbi:uncharacterized protein TRIADDRAFT_52778 [Trichoplax adhaerens]|uniref:Uncharacterized protein n=1 Tax=Trichoplax adhaerens TaxID=10228 RepID=B3RKB0_TRIAD|nr:hypothetical protein TRIADDRAFT_52778 [Trichoplax adhaerens]EDV29896.1 hypothetical protein TRIADDRAFT_52778 [Trichoplax adhaerens]|eukprot:XP_002109098.1 hypothetical protein TRIADDRAFT_52778 [Trichoplax adhaerens]
MELTMNQSASEKIILIKSMRQNGQLYYNARDYLAAKSFLEQGLQLTKSAEENQRSAEFTLIKKDLLLFIATVCIIIGDYQKATDCIQEVKEISEKEGDGVFLARCHDREAEIKKAFREYDRALALANKSLQIKCSILCPRNSLDVADSYTLIGYIHYDKEEYSKALAAHHAALDIRLKARKEDSRKVAKSLENLGKIYFKVLKYDDAMEMCQSSVKILLASTDHNYYDIIDVYNCIADIHICRLKYNLAIETYQKILKNYTSTLGDSHPIVQCYMRKIAKFFHEFGRNIDIQLTSNQILLETQDLQQKDIAIVDDLALEGGEKVSANPIAEETDTPQTTYNCQAKEYSCVTLKGLPEVKLTIPKNCLLSDTLVTIKASHTDPPFILSSNRLKLKFVSPVILIEPSGLQLNTPDNQLPTLQLPVVKENISDGKHAEDEQVVCLFYQNGETLEWKKDESNRSHDWIKRGEDRSAIFHISQFTAFGAVASPSQASALTLQAYFVRTDTPIFFLWLKIALKGHEISPDEKRYKNWTFEKLVTDVDEEFKLPNGSYRLKFTSDYLDHSPLTGDSNVGHFTWDNSCLESRFVRFRCQILESEFKPPELCKVTLMDTDKEIVSSYLIQVSHDTSIALTAYKSLAIAIIFFNFHSYQ